MLALLSKGDFDGVFAAIGRLQQIHRPHPTLDEESAERFSRLMTFEQEIATISGAETAAHGGAEVLLRGHGVIRPRLGCRLFRIAYVTPSGRLFGGLRALHVWGRPPTSSASNLTRVSSRVHSCAHSLDRYHTPLRVDPSTSHAAVTEAVFAARETAFVDVQVSDAVTMDSLPQAETLTAAVAASESGTTNGPLVTLTFDGPASAPQALFALSVVPCEPIFCHTEIAQAIFAIAYGRAPDSAGADAGAAKTPREGDFLSGMADAAGASAADSPFHVYPRKGCRGGVVLERVDVRSTRQLLGVLQRLRQQLTVNELLMSCLRAGKVGAIPAAELSLVGPGHIALQLQHPTSARLCSVEVTVSDRGTVACKITTLPGDDAPCTEADFLAALTARLSIPDALQTSWGPQPPDAADHPSKRSRT
jgi:hypothetical protein